jgi:hypothetical protein
MQKELDKSIDRAIYELEQYGSKYNVPDNAYIISALKVLTLLKADLHSNGLQIRERILRGFKDVCTSTAVHWEGTTIEEAIFDVYHRLNNSIPSFYSLELLRGEFGKGDPI